MFNDKSQPQLAAPQGGYLFSFGKPCDILIQPKPTVKKFKCDSAEQSEIREKLASLLTQGDNRHVTSPKMKEEESPHTGKFFSDKSMREKSHLTQQTSQFEQFEDVIRNVQLGRKTKRTTEELVLDRIQKEKEQLKKQKRVNASCYKKSKKYVPLSFSPAPLTLIKPFHLSSSSLTSYLKRRMTRSETDIQLLNSKIKNKAYSKLKRCQIL